MRGFLRPLDDAFATGSAIAQVAASLVGVFVGFVVTAFAAVVAVPLAAPMAYAQGASGSAASAPARQKETAMLHWGTTVVWFRATAADSVLVFASPGFRNPFAHPIAVSADDIERWAEFAQRLVVLSGSGSAVSPSSPAATPDTAHMILGAGDVILETMSDQDGMALRVNIGANRQDGQTAMLFADGAQAAAAALHDAARMARTLHVAAVAQAQAEAQAAAVAAQTAAQQPAQSPSAVASAASPVQSAAAARGVTAASAHATTRGMKPVVVSATSVPVPTSPGRSGRCRSAEPGAPVAAGTLVLLHGVRTALASRADGYRHGACGARAGWIGRLCRDRAALVVRRGMGGCGKLHPNQGQRVAVSARSSVQCARVSAEFLTLGGQQSEPQAGKGHAERGAAGHVKCPGWLAGIASGSHIE